MLIAFVTNMVRINATVTFLLPGLINLFSIVASHSCTVNTLRSNVRSAGLQKMNGASQAKLHQEL